MPPGLAHVRHGFGSVRPYLYGGLVVIDFIMQTVEAPTDKPYQERSAGARIRSETRGGLPPILAVMRNRLQTI